jgi:hypothetical protein
MQSPIWTTLLLLSALTTALAAAVNPISALAPRLNPIIPTAHLVCGHFTTADHHDVGKLIDGMWPSVPSVFDDCFTPARTCRRVACINTSAIYVRPPSPRPSPSPAVH